MRILSSITAFFLTTVFMNCFAQDITQPARFKSVQSIFGPIQIDPDQSLKICATDISVIIKLVAPDGEGALSRHTYPDQVVWSSTDVKIYDSTDTSRPLPIDIGDIIFSSGKGECFSFRGRDVGTDDASRSIMVALTTLTEAKAAFDPLVTGQLIAPNNTSGVGLIIPAVQSVRVSDSTKSCCACAPVCGCGLCDN